MSEVSRSTNDYTFGYHLDLKVTGMTPERFVTITCDSEDQARLMFWDEIIKDPDWPEVERIVVRNMP